MSESSRPRTMFVVIAACFLLSGFAALLYETVWLRQFAIILGTSEQALAVILAAYMGGLEFGSWVASRRINRIQRPVLVYGFLEAGIAVAALAMPMGLITVEALQVLLFGGAAEPPAAGEAGQIAFGLIASFGLILVPTAMMGATLPLLVKHVIRRDRDIGPRIGLLYGINTLGAVGGTLAAAFVLLPHLGLVQTTWVGAAINLAIFGLTWVAFRQMEVPVDETPELPAEQLEHDPALERNSGRHCYRAVLCFTAIAGAVSFCYEILFTRMLSHFLGGSVYAFATMLSGFLLGIAIGGVVGSRFAVRRDASIVALVYAQAMAGVATLVAYRLLVGTSDVPLESLLGDEAGGSTATLSGVTASMLVLLPVAICIGATFPLATRILAGDSSQAAICSARVYIASTIGGIVGALLTGGLIMPALAYQGTTALAVIVNASIAIAIVFVIKTDARHLIAGAVTLLMLVLLWPSRPESVLRISALTGTPTKGEMVFNEVGRSGTVTLFDQQGEIRFQTNGLPEAIVTAVGATDPFHSAGAWLGALPPLIRPDARTMCIIGLGGGVAAGHVPPAVEKIDVFELEPAVVRANEFIRRDRSRNPLADGRVQVILNDGRNGLTLTSKRYDAIVSQPSHPWTAGASHLYTRQFAATAHDRLAPGGVFLQWMNTSFVNPDLFASIAATMLDVFDHVRVYEPVQGNVLFIGSDQPIQPEQIAEPELLIKDVNRAFYDSFGIRVPTDLLSVLRIDEPDLRRIAQNATLITDGRNVLAMRAPAMLADLHSGLADRFVRQHRISRDDPQHLRRLCPTLIPMRYALRMLDRELPLSKNVLQQLFDDKVELAIYRATAARKNGDLERWKSELVAAAAGWPDDPRPAFLLLARHSLGITDLTDDQATELRTHLDDRFGELLAAVQSLGTSSFEQLYRRDELFETFEPGEAGYRLAVRMRLVWRIADQGPEMMANNLEALEIIDHASPFLGVEAVIAFRIAAAISADRPEIALAAAVGFARTTVQRIQGENPPKVAELMRLRNTLIQCRSMIGDASAFRSLDNQKYLSAIDYLDRVIAGNV